MTETNEAMVPVVENTEENELIDVLGRDGFVSCMVSVAKRLSEQQKNACYAINGRWGAGKSFVLNMFKEKMAEASDEYLVLNYNCWRYDYYEEPIIAIVAALNDSIQEEKNLSNGKKKDIKNQLSDFYQGIKYLGKDVIEEKIGIDLEKARVAFNGNLTEEEARREFDLHLSFNQSLNKLRTIIEEIAKEKTVIIAVDELDRCLPEYTIKVLERLHHVFDDIANVQVILAIDKVQLEHTVKRIYGDLIETDQYLAKFIDFEMKLDMGQFHGEELEELNNYIYACGATSHYLKRDEIYRFFRSIFKNIDIRAKKIIIQKSKLLHDLLPQGNCIESDVQLCVEVFLMVVHYKGIDSKVTHSNFDMTNVFGKDLKSDDSLYDLNERFQKGIVTHSNFDMTNVFGKDLKFDDSLYDLNKRFQKRICKYYSSYSTDDDGYSIYRISVYDIWGILLKVYRYILGFREDVADYSENSGFSGELVQYAVQYWNLMKIIA